VQRVAHAAYEAADDDRAASDPVEVAIQNEASSARRDSRPREIEPPPEVIERVRLLPSETWASGARGTRTPDLLGAIQALSQLSYSPEPAGIGNPPSNAAL
jgi:hypothetical protein